jgi:signal recognition particle receptor subunit beta
MAEDDDRAAAVADDDAAFEDAQEQQDQEDDTQQQRTAASSKQGGGGSGGGDHATLAPPPSQPPPRAPPSSAAAAFALPAALSQTAVADLLKHLPEQVQRVAGTTEGVVLLLVSAVIFALAVAALLRALLGGGGGSRRKGGATTAGSARLQGPLVVLAGPCNAGKTAIFLRLTSSSKAVTPLPGTVASMLANTATAKLGSGRGRVVTLLDVPGHASHRPRLETALADAKAVVFVVDSADVSPHRTDAADCLYDILSNGFFAKRRLPLLVACNKSDLDMDAHSADFVRRTLERQLDAMRKTRTAGIGRTAAAGEGAAALLGVAADRPFSFAAMAAAAGGRPRVALAEVSAKAEGGLAEVEAFAAGV